uniref:Uncharacterized protein n=1 Tax=Ursus americanus TaxID=9643 RepID=A0A452QJN7_URSAM
VLRLGQRLGHKRSLAAFGPRLAQALGRLGHIVAPLGLIELQLFLRVGEEREVGERLLFAQVGGGRPAGNSAVHAARLEDLQLGRAGLGHAAAAIPIPTPLWKALQHRSPPPSALLPALSFPYIIPPISRDFLSSQNVHKARLEPAEMAGAQHSVDCIQRTSSPLLISCSMPARCQLRGALEDRHKFLPPWNSQSNGRHRQ